MIDSTGKSKWISEAEEKVEPPFPEPRPFGLPFMSTNLTKWPPLDEDEEWPENEKKLTTGSHLQQENAITLPTTPLHSGQDSRAEKSRFLVSKKYLLVKLGPGVPKGP